MASSPDVHNLAKQWPNVKRFPPLITSEATPDYNCFAYAAGVTDIPWAPVKVDGYYWPIDIYDESLEAYMKAYATLGYEPCDNGSLEDGFEKIALYTDKNGEPTHAAIQRADGSWQNKLGKRIDIRHSLAALESTDDLGPSLYGNVTRFMFRIRELKPPN